MTTTTVLLLQYYYYYQPRHNTRPRRERRIRSHFIPRVLPKPLPAAELTRDRITSMNVTQLRVELGYRGLDTRGLKADLLKRLLDRLSLTL